MSRSNDVKNQYPETLAIPAGATLHQIIPFPFQVGTILKYVSGGSLMIAGLSGVLSFAGSTIAVQGSTYVVGATLSANQYLIGTSEVLNVNSSGPLFLTATGSTSICSIIRLLSD